MRELRKERKIGNTQRSAPNSQISIRKERTHGYKNTGSGSQEVLDADG